MEALDERLEIRVPTQTMRLLREEAKQRGVSVAQVVRDAIAHQVEDDRLARIRAAEALCQVDAPVADWDEMKDEIVAARQNALGAARPDAPVARRRGGGGR